MSFEQNMELQERKLLEGEYKTWYESGNFRERGFFRNGRLEGEYNSWYDRGNRKQQSFYRDGNLDGECKNWYENGTLKSRLLYRNGTLQGEFWYKNNRILLYDFYRDGTVIDKRFTLKKKRLLIRFAKLFRRREVSLDTFLISDLARLST